HAQTNKQRDPEKACPGLDAGWVAIRRKTIPLSRDDRRRMFGPSDRLPSVAPKTDYLSVDCVVAASRGVGRPDVGDRLIMLSRRLRSCSKLASCAPSRTRPRGSL